MASKRILNLTLFNCLRLSRQRKSEDAARQSSSVPLRILFHSIKNGLQLIMYARQDNVGMLLIPTANEFNRKIF